MARNKIIDLNNHLFEQLERLNNEELSKDELDIEFKRTKSMTMISTQILKTQKLNLDSITIAERYEVKVSDSFDL